MEWNPSPAVVNETVKAVRDYLNGLLAQCKTWEDYCALKFKSTNLVHNAKGFVKLKQQGVGAPLITRSKSFKKSSIWLFARALFTCRHKAFVYQDLKF